MKLVSGEGVICVAVAGAEEVVEGGGDGLVLYVASRQAFMVWRSGLNCRSMKKDKRREKDPT